MRMLRITGRKTRRSMNMGLDLCRRVTNPLSPGAVATERDFSG